MAPGNKKRIGELLVEANYITQAQLAQALDLQKTDGRRIGRILVGLGYLTEQSLIEVLEFQLGIPHVILAKRAIPPEVVKLVPETMARKYKVFPVEKHGNQLMLGMVDPADVFAIDDLKIQLGFEIQPLIISEEDLNRAFTSFFGFGDQAKEVFKELGEQIQITDDGPDDDNDAGANEAPIVKLVNMIIGQAVRQRASDIHIQPTEGDVRIRYRVDGALRDIMTSPKNTLGALVSRLKIMAHLDIAEKRLPQDGRIQAQVDTDAVDLRVSTLPTVHGEKVVMRILFKTNTVKSLDQLGFLSDSIENFRSVYTRPYGIILVTGPTGSGKSTTLSAVLNDLNSPDKNIVTVEDPVEYELRGIAQVQVNRKAGLLFSTALRSFLRQDPDIMMVGEIRDGETARIAVEAAMTGHLVLSTLHTNDAPSSLTRLIDMGIEPFLVASVVIGVLAQRLVRGLCRDCREQYLVQPDDPLRPAIQNAVPTLEPRLPLTFHRGRGCRTCNGSGLSGRTGIHEIMVINDPIRDAIRRHASADEIKKIAVANGMRTLLGDGIIKAMNGKTSLEAVFSAAYSGS